MITVNDRMQSGYCYRRLAPFGRDFADDFKPELTPAEMLELGVFGGVYLRDCRAEFPASWFECAKLANGKPDKPDKPDKALNYFGILASKSLGYWREKGWLHPDDPRGWFQWYCRYYSGRRIEGEDERQIKRWKSFARHKAQVVKNCEAGDPFCRPRQRQALLQWAYDSRVL